MIPEHPFGKRNDELRITDLVILQIKSRIPILAETSKAEKILSLVLIISTFAPNFSWSGNNEQAIL
jgi:hypothetical protein